MIEEIKINGIDVTSAKLSWTSTDQFGYYIQDLSIKFSVQLLDLVTPAIGMTLTVKRGFASVDEDFVFNGVITQRMPEVDNISFICKGMLYDAIKSSQIKSWDINIDAAAGIGSEIAKDIFEHSGIPYDSTTVVDTGTAEGKLIKKFIQRDEDDYDRLMKLAEIYNYALYFNNDEGLAHFEPKGYTIYPKTLVVGTDIPKQIKWKENGEQLANLIKIVGATAYDKISETFAGPDTEFTLTKTPEDTEVRQTNESGALFSRGQKDIGVIGTDFDYYVDVESKKIVFSSAQSNIWIRYGAQVPMPITVRNQSSIDTYGGPNKIPHTRKYTFNDIKDLEDGIARGRALLAKFSTPFIEAKEVPVVDSTIQTYGFINPGMLLTIQDPYAGETHTVIVREVIKTSPYVNDEITIGDEIWRTEDWQTNQMQKINELINQLNQNEDILIDVFDLPADISLINELTKFKGGTGDSFAVSHPTLSWLRADFNDEPDCSGNGNYGTWNGTGISGAQYIKTISSSAISKLDLDVTPLSSTVTDLGLSKNDGTYKINATGYYPFNGDASDSSENGNDAIAATGTLTMDRFYSENNAYSFTDNQLVNFGLGSGDNPSTNPVSVGGWFKFDSSDTTQIAFSFGNNTGSNQRAYCGIANSYFDIGIQSSGYGTGSAVTADDGEYHFLMLVFTGTECELYVDGVFSFSKAYTSYTFTGDLRVGGWADGDDHDFNGVCDEFIIIDGIALTSQEVLELYNQTLTHKLDKPLLDYTDDNGTIITGYDFYSAGGLGNSVETGNLAVNLTSEDYAIFVKFVVNYIGDSPCLIVGSFPEWGLTANLNSSSTYYLVPWLQGNGGTHSSTLVYGQVYSAIIQYHANSSTREIYVDDVLYTTQTGGTSTDYNLPLRLGNDTSYGGYNTDLSGIISKPIIIEKELTAEERTALFNGTSPENIPTLHRLGAGYFNGTDNRVTAANDTSLNPTDLSIFVSFILDSGSRTSNTRQALVSKDYQAYELILDSLGGTSVLKFYKNNGSTSYEEYTYTYDFQEETKYTVGITFKASTKELNFYINGVNVDTQTTTTSSITETSKQSLSVGARRHDGGNSLWFKGKIDEAMVFPYVLTATDVEIYESGKFYDFSNAYKFSGPPVLHYAFDNPMSGRRFTFDRVFGTGPFIDETYSFDTIFDDLNIDSGSTATFDVKMKAILDKIVEVVDNGN